MLLVEDAEESLNAMKELLSLYDANVSSARCATEALKLAERNPPAIVVTDTTSPIWMATNSCAAYAEFLTALRFRLWP